MFCAHLLKIGAVQPGQAAKVLQQALPYLHGILAYHAHTEQDSQQLGIGKGLGAKAGQPLARSLFFGQISYSVGGGVFVMLRHHD
jgi:hypothetical protein